MGWAGSSEECQQEQLHPRSEQAIYLADLSRGYAILYTHETSF